MGAPSLLGTIPADQQNEALVPLRYEDVAQDGRLMLTPMTVGLGNVVWRGLLSQHPGARAMEELGVVPILSRLSLRAVADGPISVHHRVRARGGYFLAHARTDAGDVERIYINMALDVHGKRDVTHGPKPTGAGEELLLGHVLAEHVFTRPFAPPAERKVLTLPFPGMPAVPEATWRTPTTAESLALPDGARWLDDAPHDGDPVTFRTLHTDGNHHVNSLVYPQLFEEAVLTRLDALGVRGTAGLLARELDLGFRKPSFAGDTVRFTFRTFDAGGGRYGATGTLVADGEPRPRTVVKLVLAPLGK